MSVIYDAAGRLWDIVDSNSSVAWKRVYAGDRIIAMRDQNGTIRRRFVYGAGVDEALVQYQDATASQRRFMMADEKRSVVNVSDASGATLGVNTYDEYGRQGANNGYTAHRYTGQTQYGRLGDIYYYKARFYNPELGRFMQTDPIGYGDGMNMYAYVGGDPVNSTDPTGLAADEVIAHETRTTYAGVNAVVHLSQGGGGGNGPGNRRSSEDEEAIVQAYCADLGVCPQQTAGASDDVVVSMGTRTHTTASGAAPGMSFTGTTSTNGRNAPIDEIVVQAQRRDNDFLDGLIEYNAGGGLIGQPANYAYLTNEGLVIVATRRNTNRYFSDQDRLALAALDFRYNQENERFCAVIAAVGGGIAIGNFLDSMAPGCRPVIRRRSGRYFAKFAVGSVGLFLLSAGTDCAIAGAGV